MKRLTFAVFAFLTGCASTEYALQENIRLDLARGETQKALQTAKSSDFYADEESFVVKNLELGLLYYLNGSCYQALKHFDAAQKKSRELYTKSLLNAALASIAGQRSENYEGEAYEMSLLRFYQSLCHYRLYKDGTYEAYADENGVQIPEKKLTDTEKRQHLRAARAVMLDWDAVLREYQRERAGQSLFKRDMAAKLWGGFIHERNRLSEDRQIARQLYKDASDVLFRNYNLYPAYNEKADLFSEKYENLHKTPVEKARKELVSKTNAATHLEKYAKKSLNDLSNRRENNVFVLLKTGRIAQKKAETASYVIPWFLLLGSASDNSFRRFIRTVLPGQIIEFEIPVFEAPLPPGEYKIIIKDAKGHTVAEKNAVLIDPVSEIAARDAKTMQSELYAEKAARMATKHAAALAAAYQLYDENNESTLWSARLSYTLSAALIAKSEEADLRYWGSLPADIWIQSFNLPPAAYEIRILRGNDAVFSEKLFVPSSGTAFKDINLR